MREYHVYVDRVRFLMNVPLNKSDPFLLVRRLFLVALLARYFFSLVSPLALAFGMRGSPGSGTVACVFVRGNEIRIRGGRWYGGRGRGSCWEGERDGTDAGGFNFGVRLGFEREVRENVTFEGFEGGLSTK